MNYRVNKFNVNLGFDVNEDCILNATKELNNFLKNVADLSLSKH